MYEIRADVTKNRLYLTLKGYMPPAESAPAAEKAIAETKKLRPGFAVISDISEFKPAGEEGVKHIQTAQAFLKQHGVGRVIRVVKSTVTAMQFQRTGKQVGFEADTAASVAEAEARLDAEKK